MWCIACRMHSQNNIRLDRLHFILNAEVLVLGNCCFMTDINRNLFQSLLLVIEADRPLICFLVLTRKLHSL